MQLTFLNVTYVIYFILLLKIESKNCNFNIQVEQILRNEGSHRNLSINIDFASDNEAERWLYEDCMVGIEQMLPRGVYASIDEIKDSGCKDLIKAIFKTPVNIELPSKKSEPITIHLLSKVRDYSTNIYIPVHARYHHAIAGGGTVRNEIPVPSIYLLCPNKRLDQCSDLYTEQSSVNHFCADYVLNEDCAWKEIPAIMVTAPIAWDVPVGNTDHYPIVAFGTALVIVVGSLYLMKALHEYKIEVKRSNKIKRL